jgi:hypothetical protein
MTSGERELRLTSLAQLTAWIADIAHDRQPAETGHLAKV